MCIYYFMGFEVLLYMYVLRLYTVTRCFVQTKQIYMYMKCTLFCRDTYVLHVQIRGFCMIVSLL